ncbi:MAG: hypothetical protein VX405_11010 [Myxococcota bacterium]|nr:hypothetical protein [Myxococcota bacterium]
MSRHLLILSFVLMACPKESVPDADAGIGVDAGVASADAGSVVDAGACDPDNIANDPNNCGVCDNVCAFFGAEALCVEGECQMGSCRTGFHDLDGLTDNGCEYECRVTDPLDPVDEDGVDANCDGFDGVLSRLIFVSTNGSDDGTGTPEDPVLTMAGALDLVDGDTGRQRLILAEGTYSVAGLGDIPAGVSLIAGYSSDGNWTRSALARAELVDATEPLLLGGGEGVLIEGVEVRVPDAPLGEPGSMSAALIIENGDGVQVRNSVFSAGRGSDGLAASPVDPQDEGAAPGTQGGNGVNGCEDGPVVCGSCDRPRGGAPGTSPCGRPGGEGGRPRKGNNSGADGSPGVGGTAAGTGGQSGQDGRDGANGAPGAAGIAGRGGAAFGTFDQGSYQAARGANGGEGAAGNGGGGGGGGGGGDVLCPSYGGGGGGGGGGGCGGLGGGGGGGGGASVAVLVLSGAADFESCSFITGGGGDGGAGVAGQRGGRGGDGGTRGQNEDDSGAGGAGGAGGSGGDGGGGGGGGGGPSVGIWSVDGTDFDVTGCTFDLANGGRGGGSVAQPGEPGAREQVVVGRD